MSKATATTPYQDRLAVLNRHMEIQVRLTKVMFYVMLIILMITVVLAVWTYRPISLPINLSIPNITIPNNISTPIPSQP